MKKRRIEIDGKFYRERRGKLVQIPDEWVGEVTTHQTRRKRQSHQTRKIKNLSHKRNGRDVNGNSRYLRIIRGEDVFGDLNNWR